MSRPRPSRTPRRRSKATTSQPTRPGSTASRQPRSHHGGSQAVLKASNPGDVITLIPYQLGFRPEDSLVLAAVNQPRGRLGPILRIDLPDPADHQVIADHLVQVLRHHKLRRVIAIAYSPPDAVVDSFVDQVATALASHAITLLDAWRADGRRWFSYLCQNPVCCPPEGVVYGKDVGPVAAEATYAGAVALPDRQALRDSIARLPDPDERMAAATAAAVAAWADRPLAGPKHRAWLGREMVRMENFVTAFSSQRRVLDDTECARLSLAVQDIMVRDTAWALMNQHNIEPHVDLWTQVTRRAVDGFIAAPASLLGFAVWIHGSGALARCATERALTDDPGYSMAHLLEDALDRCVPPSVWRPFPLDELYLAAGCQRDLTG